MQQCQCFGSANAHTLVYAIPEAGFKELQAERVLTQPGDVLCLQLERLELAFDSIKRQLFGQLHDVLRKQLFGGVDAAEGSLPQGSSTTNGNSRLGTSKNGGSKIVSNTSTAPPIFEAVLNKSIELDKDPDSISQSLKQ